MVRIISPVISMQDETSIIQDQVYTDEKIISLVEFIYHQYFSQCVYIYK